MSVESALTIILTVINVGLTIRTGYHVKRARRILGRWGGIR